MDKSKPFGLIISKRAQSRRPAVNAAFGSDSDDEPSAKKKKMPAIPQAKPKKMPIPEIGEDPSIYEYDSIYDDMKAQEVAKVAPKDTNKPSRYIGSLLKAADKRKKDQERRVEKKVHHERELEGDKFADKEAFVTSAYKKKMQEMEEEEERERRENMLNEMMDVTKQKDLSGFYRHFLKQSVGEENVPVFGERYQKKDGVKEERVSDEDSEMPGTVDVHQEAGGGSSGVAGKSSNKKKKDVDQEAGERSSARDGVAGKSSRRYEKRDGIKQERISDDDSAMLGTREKEKDVGVHQEAEVGSSGVAGKSSMPKKGKTEPVLKRKRDHGDSAMPRISKEREDLDSDVDRDTDMGSSSDEDGVGNRVDKLSKEAVVGELSNKKAKESVPAVGKKTGTEKSVLDDNVDRDTDIEYSSDEDTIDRKAIQQSKDTEIGKSTPKKPTFSKKSSTLVDNIDQDSNSSLEAEYDKSASGIPSEAAQQDFPRKKSRKPPRNIRKRAEDGDSAPDSDESSSESDEETAEGPKANGGSEEEPSISESTEQVKAQPLKPKVDIYAKRTVGDVFADAQVRYFQRMAARST